jgi:hypothetical protein
MTTDYQQAKKRLKQIAIECKSIFKNDKPQWRMIINDNCDSLCKEYHFSEYKRSLLENYSCDLHPKD